MNYKVFIALGFFLVAAFFNYVVLEGKFSWDYFFGEQTVEATGNDL